jgi:hypothetical protein
MKHASTRELYSYWNARRGSRSAPERGEIEPGAIRHVLGDSFVLSFEPSLDHPFRLAGTRVCALFGRELKTEPFVHLWDGADRAQLRDILTIVADEAIGTVAGATAATEDGARVELELLLLPLRHHGDLHARVLGALAPNECPYWLGRHAVKSLTLGTLRYLDPGHDVDTPFGPPRAPVSTNARGRLTVYDGGRGHQQTGHD